MQHSLGRIEVVDERDKNFPVSTVLSESPGGLPDISTRQWWANGWWGNQGPMPHCVAYAWQHFLEDGPVIQDSVSHDKPFYNPKAFYDLCQLHDQWPGENYDGTSIRAGAKILKAVGVIKAYRWAFNIEEVVKTVKYIGPMVVGTRWYSNMTHPSNNVMSPNGAVQGGHAYLINGCDDNKELLRVKNSWGRGWGNNGHAFISYDDFDALLSDGGDACIAFENKMNTVPELLLD